MLEGRTADCSAIANTAILMRLVEELIASGVITRPVATTVLKDAGPYRHGLAERPLRVANMGSTPMREAMDKVGPPG